MSLKTVTIVPQTKKYSAHHDRAEDSKTWHVFFTVHEIKLASHISAYSDINNNIALWNRPHIHRYEYLDNRHLPGTSANN